MKAVLVDTSLWIAYFRKDADTAVQSELREALLEGRIATCWPVLGELLVGARNHKDKQRLKELLSALHWLPTDDKRGRLPRISVFTCADRALPCPCRTS